MASAKKSQRTQSAEAGIIIGSGKNALPTVLENLVLGFLEIDDVASLFYASKAASASAVRFLQELRSLRFPFQRDAFDLVVKHCRSLRDIGVAPPAYYHAVEPRRLACLIETNRGTLRSVDTAQIRTDSSKVNVFSALVQCKQLESLHLIGDASSPLPDGVFAAVTPVNLPQLRSLSLYAFECGGQQFGGEAASQTQILTILSQGLLPAAARLIRCPGLRLDNLKLSEVANAVVAPLTSGHFAGLHSLHLRFGEPPLLITMQRLTSALGNMHSLGQLELSCWYGFNLVACISVSHLAVDLPSLRSLELRDWPFLPAFRASNLLAVDLRLSGDASIANAVSELCERSDKLETVKVEMHGAARMSVKRFAASLLSVRWPKLRSLSYLALADEILRALVSKPRPLLRSLDIGVDSCATVCSFLRAHPGIEELRVESGSDGPPIDDGKQDSAAGSTTVTGLRDMDLHIRYSSLARLRLDKDVRLSSPDIITRACPVLRDLSLFNTGFDSCTSLVACSSLRGLTISLNDRLLGDAASLSKLVRAFPAETFYLYVSRFHSDQQNHNLVQLAKRLRESRDVLQKIRTFDIVGGCDCVTMKTAQLLARALPPSLESIGMAFSAATHAQFEAWMAKNRPGVRVDI